MPSHKILNIISPRHELQAKLSNELGISTALAQLLINRGITTSDDAGMFLSPETSGLLDPFSFRDMDKAVSRIRLALDRKEKVLAHGDYDADGITSVVLLMETFKKCGLNVIHHLPHRVKEGYGLNKAIVERCRKEGVKLVVTADCGISSHEIIDELNSHGIDTIVTDHHEPSSRPLPNAVAIINPKVTDCGYAFRDLAGVGVAFKLCQALAQSDLADELDLVSLGTIADSVALRGENRIIAKEGLVRLSSTRRIGLKALMEHSSIKKMNTTAVSFILAPRINASGRVDSAETSLSLLMSQSIEEAQRLAKALEDYNRQRQKIEAKILEEAEDLINSEVNFKDHKVIVIEKEDWHHGVLGIVASKLADRFYRPAIVISLGDTVCKGSGRSIKNFHLLQALCECGEFLSSFGGHSHAAGLVITRDSIQAFRETINRLAHDQLALEDLLPSIDIDMELALSGITEDFVRELECLEPFGVGNSEPLFLTKDLKLKGQPQVLSRQTLKFWVTDGTYTYQAIGFGMSSFKNSLMQCDHFDMIHVPRMDSWWGVSTILLEAKDIFFR